METPKDLLSLFRATLLLNNNKDHVEALAKTSSELFLDFVKFLRSGLSVEDVRAAISEFPFEAVNGKEIQLCIFELAAKHYKEPNPLPTQEEIGKIMDLFRDALATTIEKTAYGKT